MKASTILGRIFGAAVATLVVGGYLACFYHGHPFGPDPKGLSELRFFLITAGIAILSGFSFAAAKDIEG